MTGPDTSDTRRAQHAIQRLAEVSLTSIARRERLKQLEARQADPGFWSDPGEGPRRGAGDQDTEGAGSIPPMPSTSGWPMPAPCRSCSSEAPDAELERELGAELEQLATALTDLELQTHAPGPRRRRRRHSHRAPGRRRHRVAGLGRDAHADVRALGGAQGLRGDDPRHGARRRGRDQVGDDRDQGPVRLRFSQGGEGRAPAGADLAVRFPGAPAHLVRLGLRLPRHRRHHRGRPPRRGHQDGRVSRVRAPAASTSTRRRPRCGSPTSRPGSWWPASGAEPAQEQGDRV